MRAQGTNNETAQAQPPAVYIDAMPTIDMPWGKQAYRDTLIGRGDRTLILLHGTGGQADHWQSWLDALQSQGWAGRVVTVEFRGHGESDACDGRFTLHDLAADVAAIIKHTAPTRPTLVGHSLGGMVALAGETLWPADARLVLIEGWTRLACAARCGKRHMWGNLSERDIAATRADWQANVGRFESAQWEAFWQSVQQADARDVLASTGRQVLSIYGSIDLPTDLRAAMELPDRPNLPLATIAKAGHYTHFEQPAPAAEVLRDF